jgi:hypothetical protein
MAVAQWGDDCKLSQDDVRSSVGCYDVGSIPAITPIDCTNKI